MYYMYVRGKDDIPSTNVKGCIAENNEKQTSWKSKLGHIYKVISKVNW